VGVACRPRRTDAGNVVGMKRGDGAAAIIDQDLIGLTKVGDALSGISVSVSLLVRLKPSPVAYPDPHWRKESEDQSLSPGAEDWPSVADPSIPRNDLRSSPRKEAQYAMLNCRMKMTSA